MTTWRSVQVFVGGELLIGSQALPAPQGQAACPQAAWDSCLTEMTAQRGFGKMDIGSISMICRYRFVREFLEKRKKP